MSKFDIIIKNGTIYDGSGEDSFTSDISIKDGKIIKIGKCSNNDTAKDIINAENKIVTPGFVDIHTHYDGQATWDNYISPSSWYGVTTAIMGNCGVGFAPVRKEDHQKLINLMEGVEDIPEVVLTEGIEWQWETYNDYMDVLSNRKFDIDIGSQIPHGALRLYVMGQRGADREAATDEDILKMSALASDAVENGAFGFTTSRTINHRTSEGDYVPQLEARENELIGIARSIGKTNKGVLQVVSDFLGGKDEYLMLEKMVIESKRPLSITVAQTDAASYEWKELLSWIENSGKNGLPIRAQVSGRPIGLVLGLSVTLNPFSGHPSFKEISNLSLNEKLKIMKNSDFKNRIFNEKPNTDDGLMLSILRNYENIYILDNPPDYEPDIEESLGYQAKLKGLNVIELLYETLLKNKGEQLLYFPIGNYMDGSLDASKRMIESNYSLLALGDGGAHCSTICDASFPTHMMTFWGRDRKRGPKIELPWIIKSYTYDNANAMGLTDRGLIKEGMLADINIIDFDNLQLYAPELVSDLPAGGKRLIQNVDGYDATIKSGVITYNKGVATKKLPGRLIRN
tara:strand:- start:705 stop:2414 length:1710 start_codon:yes stop_codon:yes gene_type:complete